MLYRRSVIYTAPSGTGKTSLLRAGLVAAPRGARHPRDLPALPQPTRAALATAIAPGARDIDRRCDRASPRAARRQARARPRSARGRARGSATLVASVARASTRWPADADVSVVLIVREDYLARLVARTQKLEPEHPDRPPAAAQPRRRARRDRRPAHRSAPRDRARAPRCAARRPRSAPPPRSAPRWAGATRRAVYPPHLQLACSVLYEALGSGEATITLAHYRKLGGFDAIVGEHLERVLDTELADGRDVIARDLFVALVTTRTSARSAPSPSCSRSSARSTTPDRRHRRARDPALARPARARARRRRARAGSWSTTASSPRVLAWIDRARPRAPPRDRARALSPASLATRVADAARPRELRELARTRPRSPSSTTNGGRRAVQSRGHRFVW